jgi:hypothetical protein
MDQVELLCGLSAAVDAKLNEFKVGHPLRNAELERLVEEGRKKRRKETIGKISEDYIALCIKSSKYKKRHNP